MNRTFTLLSLFLISLLTSASTVDVETARKVAEKAVGKPCLEKKVTLRRASTAQGKLPSYYLFTGNDGYGFALVSSMEEDAPLLGYGVLAKCYASYRHEIQHEPVRGEYFRDIAGFLDK